MDIKKSIEDQLDREWNYSYIVPLISGSTALVLLSKIIFSDLEFYKYLISVITIIIVFIVSAILFFLLKKAEKDKDQYLLSIVGKIVEDVFKHYGATMASNAAGPTIATEMNPIMQTIVNLVAGLKELMTKTYVKS